MSTARTANVPNPETMMLIDLAAIRVAPWNARKTMEPVALAQLASSIVEHGVQVPLLVRYREDADVYEIVCGHRRFAAAGMAGRTVVPCIERALNDDQAREIGLVDNLQREDVPALEEADAYKELQQRLGTAAAIAARVGKDVSYVTRRLQLISLAEMPRKALAERLITVDHALLLARLGETEQDANLKWCLNPNSGIKEPVETTIAQRIQERDRKNRYAPWEAQSVLELKHHIEQNVGRKLSRAPWVLTDGGLLEDAPACSECPSNTKANDALFADLNIAAATCENGTCFEAKRTAFVQIRLSEATGKQDAGLGQPIRLSWKTTTVKPRAAKPDLPYRHDGFNLAQVFRYGQWIDAKKGSCEHLRLGVTVDWDEPSGWGDEKKSLRKPGQILTVCIAEKCKVHRKGYAEKKETSPGLRNENAAEARADREKREAEVKEENALRMDVIRKAVDRVQKIPAEILRRLLVETCRATWDIEQSFPGIEKALKAKAVDSAEFARAAVCLVFGNDESEFFVDEYNRRDNIAAGRKELIAVLKLLGYDASKAWEKPAKKGAKKAAKKGGRK
jgi:ParB/RepB/Spo0J family partition protein